MQEVSIFLFLNCVNISEITFLVIIMSRNKRTFMLMIDTNNFSSADIFVTPPIVAELTEEYIVEEDGGGRIENQLTAEAEAIIRRNDNESCRAIYVYVYECICM